MADNSPLSAFDQQEIRNYVQNAVNSEVQRQLSREFTVFKRGIERQLAVYIEQELTRLLMGNDRSASQSNNDLLTASAIARSSNRLTPTLLQLAGGLLGRLDKARRNS